MSSVVSACVGAVLTALMRQDVILLLRVNQLHFLSTV